MKIAIVRDRNPNISEIFSFSRLEQFGIEPTLIAEVSEQYQKEISEMHLIPLIRARGLYSLMPFSNSKAASLLRAGIEQKIGLWAPVLETGVWQRYDLFNVSGVLGVHAYQISRHIERNPQKKLIVTLWENIPDREKRSILGPSVHSRVMNGASHFIAISGTAAAIARMSGVSSSLISVIQPAVDTNMFISRSKPSDLLETYGISSDDIVLVFNGRLQESKGPHVLLRAMAYISLTWPDLYRSLKLLVIGGGRDERKLAYLAGHLRIEDRVIFSGRVSFRMIPRLYNCGDIFVMPSLPVRWWQEQLGFSLLEAMSSSLCVIGTHSGAIPEVLDGCGALVSPGDFLDLATTIRDLVLDDRRRIACGSSARKLVADRNNIERVTERLTQVIRRISS